MLKCYITIILAIFCKVSFSQDCRVFYQVYEEQLLKDKTILRVAGEAPEIFEYSRFLMDVVASLKLEACPFKVYTAFVIEPDSSLSNIFVCSRMMCMNDSCNEERAKLNFEKDLKTALVKSKLPPVKHQGKVVRYFMVIPAHYECRE